MSEKVDLFSTTVLTGSYINEILILLITLMIAPIVMVIVIITKAALCQYNIFGNQLHL